MAKEELKKQEPEEISKETEGVAEEIKKEELIKPEESKKIEKESTEIEAWNPKTEIGRKVKNGEITDINEILDNGLQIKEKEIVDALIPDLEVDLLLIGQSKGKFGGGKRRVFKQTQKKTKEGNKPKFATFAVVGDRKGHVGIGYGKSKETVPAREKAIRNAKLNLIKIINGCGSWQCGCRTGHSVPFAIEGKCGSIRIKIMPAPKGTGLVIQNECAKILKFAGINDVWSKAIGKTKTRINVVLACFDALKKLITTKVKIDDYEKIGIKK